MNLVALTLLFVSPSQAGMILSQDKALELAFGGAKVTREVVYLKKPTAKKIENRARAILGKRVVVYYVGRSSEGILGYALFDTHLVRSLNETVMVVLNSEGVVSLVETTAFFEPMDYKPVGRWYERFIGKTLDRKLRVGRGVAAVSGATLTTRAVTAAVRRSLAVFEVLIQGKMEPPQ